MHEKSQAFNLNELYLSRRVSRILWYIRVKKKCSYEKSILENIVKKLIVVEEEIVMK